MRKIILDQPFASMVICGTLQTIPDKWGDIKIGEKILVYAGDISKEYLHSQFDCGSELDRKYSNEIFLGNIPDTTYKVNEYLGYVTVTAHGTTTEGWPLNTEKYIYVCKPYEFEQKIDNYNEDILKLDNLPAHPFQRNIMKRKGDELIIPVGESGWNAIRDKEHFKDTFVFWEDYMNRIIPSPWNPKRTEEHEGPICRVFFVHKNQEVIFETNLFEGVSESGWSERHYIKNGEDHRVETFEFNLYDLDMCSKVGFIENELEEKYSSRNQWVKMISTPMGGMTRWKRK